MGTFYLLSFLVLCLFIVPIIYEINTNKFDVFNIKNGFLFYLVLQVLVSGLISINIDFDEVTSLSLKYSGTQLIYFNKAILALFLALFFFQLGYYLTKKSIKIPSKFPQNFKNRRVNFCLAIFIFIGYVSFLILINNNGGLRSFVENIETFRAGGLVGQGFLIYPATRLMSISVCIYLIYILSNKFIPGNNKKTFVIIILSLIPSYFMGFRSFLIIPFISFSLIYNYAYRKFSIKSIFLSFSALIILFTSLGIYRAIPKDININYNALINIAKEKPQLVYSFLVRSKGTEVLASVIKDMEDNGNYELGYKSAIEMSTIIIPKSIWKNKPIPSSIRFTNRFFGDLLNYKRNVFKDDWSGISPTILGELFWNFGWFGITLGMFVLGLIYKIIYLTFLRNKHNNFVLLIYALIFPSLCLSAESFQGYFNGLSLDFYFFIFTLLIINSYFKLVQKS
tara:strand:+ start:1159 stop:2514 length:1356 start_codon:yes stop_codon:yes gene_type:complete